MLPEVRGSKRGARPAVGSGPTEWDEFETRYRIAASCGYRWVRRTVQLSLLHHELHGVGVLCDNNRTSAMLVHPEGIYERTSPSASVKE